MSAPQVDAWVGSDGERTFLIREYADGTKTAELRLGSGYTGEVALEPEPWDEWVATQYFIAPDGGGEPSLWQENGELPVQVQRRCDVSPLVWSLLVRWARGTAPAEAVA